MFENRVLRRVFRPKRDKVTGKWRNYIMRSLIKLHFAKYYSGDQIEKNVVGGM